MPERSQKRKLRSDQSTSRAEEDVASSTNDENTLLSDKDFEDISNKIENKISKRLRDTELNQREILKLIESLSSKVDNLSSGSIERGCLTTRTENSGNPTDELEEVDFAGSESSNMVTGVINEPSTSNNTHPRSSSLPPPNQRHSDEIIDKLLESFYATHKQTPNLPRLPKALATTMPTFDGKTEKFELFEDLFQTSLKVHPQIGANENTVFSLTTARRRLANIQEYDQNNQNQPKRHHSRIQKKIRKNTISGHRQVQVGEPHIRPGESNLPKFLRNLPEAGTRGIRGRRAQVYRDLVLRKNARPP